MDNIKEKIKQHVMLLNKAARAYYQDAEEIMSNLEYDKLYDELVEMEEETGIVLAGSPTQNVGYEIVSELPKERHPQKMLSLDKTKSREELRDWLGDQVGLLSWKLDGLTVVLTYEEGNLVKALTRGNGEVGEVITANAKAFANIPLSVPFGGKLVLRGEAVIKYSDFEKINASIGDADAKYKNPRNLCSGSVRQLNSRITAERNVHFFAFSLVEAMGMYHGGTMHGSLEWLEELGFDVVQYKEVTKDNIMETIEWFEKTIETNDFPSDGLVLLYDDEKYGKSLGTTAKFPRDSIAFKWKDQLAETTLQSIEWSASRTGLINPVAVFDPVELEGTTVSRASVHNISVMEELELGPGDRITVYKANMIIPQIGENLTKKGSMPIPEFCPVCGGPTKIKDDSGIRTLICTNPECLAKQIKSFTHFVSRDALNIDGLSEATIEKLIAKGLIKEMADIFKVESFREEIVSMEGFGEKSFAKLKESVEEASHTTPDRLLYAIGVPNIGVANAKVIAGACHQKWSKIQSLSAEELTDIEGIGEIMADSYVNFFADPDKKAMVDDILRFVQLNEEEEEREDFFEGTTFVITGSLNHYENRDALKTEIEKAGGKVAGSVSSKTSYLINNDLNSASGKNKKAKELNVPIIDEDTVMSWLEAGEIENA